jgi:hypothetical protein
MLQAYVSSVSDVSGVCFICVFWTHVARVFIWMLHMFCTYVACVLFRCCVWLQWFSSVFQVFFSSVSEACFKCFNCLQTYVVIVVFGLKVDQVLHLSFPPSAASSLPASVGHQYDSVAGSFRIGGTTRPSPLVAWAAQAPRGARNGVQCAGVRLDIRVLALP